MQLSCACPNICTVFGQVRGTGGCDGEQALHLGDCVADVGGSKMSRGNGQLEEQQRKTHRCYSQKKCSVGVERGRGGRTK